MSEVILQAENLKKYFTVGKGTLHAVDGISVQIKKGKTLGVVGESGCGKSTLGRTLIRLQKPTQGQILFDGQDITAMDDRQFAKIRPGMQMIFQDPYSSLNGRMTVSQLIEEPLIVNKFCRSKR